MTIATSAREASKHKNIPPSQLNGRVEGLRQKAPQERHYFRWVWTGTLSEFLVLVLGNGLAGSPAVWNYRLRERNHKLTVTVYRPAKARCSEAGFASPRL